jgi:ParE toxin of type II toxin-antitoxin system, parDE
MTYKVLLTIEVQEELERLFDFVLERELARDGGDLDAATNALSATKAGLSVLERFPFTCRKAADTPFLRELVIPFASTGYVALFEVVDGETVVVGAAGRA